MEKMFGKKLAFLLAAAVLSAGAVAQNIENAPNYLIISGTVVLEAVIEDVPADVVIPEGVTEIKPNAFGGCKTLKTLQLPTSLTKIGENAFRDCTSLKGVVIPDGVTEIQSGTFAGCKSIAILTIGRGVKHIYYMAFYGCNSLKTVEIPGNVTTINSSFENCKSLENIVLREGVEDFSIGDGEGSFQSLSSITIPMSIKSFHIPNWLSGSIEQVNYSGTRAQWLQVNKGDSTYGLTIHCTDGDYTRSYRHYEGY